jgi:carbon storage regulator
VLVLTRRSGESIVIGNDIVVTVLEIRHDQVRIGIQAPRSIQVHREEIYQQISRENTAAVTSAEKAKALLRRLPPGALPPRGPAPAPGGGQASTSNRTGDSGAATQPPTGP